ncbi:MAG: protein translocase subunit SecD, partial [Acidobacteriota bacterium]|nr:protein translocase subunit SecD [Acidobacteriota bacterium]
MSKNLKGRTIAIIAILVICCYGMFGIPHGVTPTALKEALVQRINLGLDLKGGTHLILQVHVEDAISDTTDRDVERIQEDLAKQSITGASAHKLDAAHPEVITVTGVPAAKASDTRSLLEGTEYVNYDVGSNPDGSLKLALKPGAIRTIEQTTLDHSIETIRERLSPLGVTEPLVAPYGLGNWEVLVEMPNVSDPGKVEDAIKSTSKLAVYAVVSGPYQDDQSALTALNGVVPPDDVLIHGSGSGSANGTDEVYLLQRASIVEGNDFRDAQPGVDQEGRPNMSFTLTTDAGNRFYTYTSAHSKDSASPGKMAIVLGGKVKEVAAIDSSIRDRGEIHGSFTKAEVENLSLMLRTGNIPASITTLDTTSVGPSLGAESIRQGVMAAVAGMLAVMVFMLVYYRGAGINADLALFLNLVILLGFMGFSNSTLTLPGIAGVILTIGMGVDSNVLIFERIREELRAGKTAAAAVQQGFGHAWITIVD